MQPLTREPMNYLRNYQAGRKRPGQCILEGYWSMAGYPLHSENRENGTKNPCQGKHREFGIVFQKTGNLVDSSCKFPDS